MQIKQLTVLIWILRACCLGSDWVLPVNHAGTTLAPRLKKVAVHMKELLLRLLRSAGLKTSWKRAAGGWEEPSGSCPLSLLHGTGAAVQPRPPSGSGHGDLAAGCLEIHVCLNLVSHKLLGPSVCQQISFSIFSCPGDVSMSVQLGTDTWVGGYLE